MTPSPHHEQFDNLIDKYAKIMHTNASMRNMVFCGSLFV